MIPSKIVLCTLPIVAPGRASIYMDPTKAYKQPRLGVQAIRDYLISKSIPNDSIRFLDIEMLNLSDEVLEDYFLKTAPDIVGLSGVLSHSYLQVERVSAIVRRLLPEAWIIVGGHITASANLILRKTPTDICIVGDGEEPFYSVVQFIESGSPRSDLVSLAQSPGIAILSEQNELVFSGYPKKPRGETIPMPDYKFFESGLLDHPDLISQYFQPAQAMGPWFSLDDRAASPGRRPNSAQVPTTKGCTARCTFCQRSTRGYRLADLENLEEHLEEIIEKFDVGFIDVLDENFAGRKDHARKFADLMQKHNLLWTAGGVRCTNVDEEDVKYFKERGCCSLKFGVESGSQKILDVMEKNFSLDDVENALTACWENGLYSPLAVMVGMPGESLQTGIETGRWIGQMAYKLGVHPDHMQYAVFYALPFPGTPLYDYCKQVGALASDFDSEHKYLRKMANGRTNKWDYVNVNGARVSEVLAWDYLIEFEAAITYASLEKKKPPKGSVLANRWAKLDQIRTQHATKRKIRESRLSLTALIKVLELIYRSRGFRALNPAIGRLLIRLSFFSAIFLYHWSGRLLGKTVFMFYKDCTAATPFAAYSSGQKRLQRSLRWRVAAKKGSEGEDSDLIASNKLLKGAAG